MPDGPYLTSRRAVDLMRVASELCPGR
ncbi:putative leader peptide [Micromonospora sp. NPDC048986]